jgi:ubiquinone/menaquinone biosynthesis C-methylase UbiE
MSEISPDIETASQEYAGRFSGPVGEWFLKVQEESVLAMMQDFEKARVLEVGGGHAQLVPGLLRNNHRVTILGSAPECQNRILKELDKKFLEFQLGHLTQIPYEDCRFDVALCFRQIPHVHEWPILISELCRVAKQSVIVDFPVLRSLNIFSNLFFPMKKKIEKNTRVYTLFWESEILCAFKKNGFHLSSKTPEFFLPMALHRFLKSSSFSSLAEKCFQKCGLTALFGSPLIARFDRQ